MSFDLGLVEALCQVGNCDHPFPTHAINAIRRITDGHSGRAPCHGWTFGEAASETLERLLRCLRSAIEAGGLDHGWTFTDGHSAAESTSY